MKTKKYFIIPFLAFLACSCQDEEQGSIQPTPGQDVQFGASLEKTATRTIYGDKANDAFPIYWVNGDEVIVCSPECATEGGVGTATYKVNVGENTTQNYATSLDKTGEIGVRWGDNPTGNFYSFYPASRAVLGGDYKTMTVTMPVQQDNNIVGEETAEGVKKIKVNPDMRACFMYAKQTANSGETVNLQYIPLSTAIRFTLEGPSSGEVGVSYVRIYAPEGTVIDGSFTLDYSGTGKPALSTVNGRNYVTMNAADPVTNEYLTLGPNESAELCAFLLIPKEMTITNDWYMLIGTTDGQIFKKSLGVLANSGGNSTLVPGQVHYLPSLPKLEAGGAWDPTNWMVNIQRNVYLSEISIPGSWNSLNSEYQTQSISQQYQKGVRAFHLDTRWKESVLIWEKPELAIANGGRSVGDDGDRYMSALSGAPTFDEALGQIVNNVKGNEYMVVVCTFAQGSAPYVYGTNTDGTNKVWIHRISEICNQSKYDGKIVDGSTLTPNTVVGDVLGKVIVIVNTYTGATINDSKCLYMNVRMELEKDEFKNNPYLTRNLNYWDTQNGASGIKVYATHAQLTKNDTETTTGNNDSGRGYEPTLLERRNKIDAILSQSKQNYSNLTNYAHDTWMYIGCGGYINENGDDKPNPVTSYFLNYMADKVAAMDTEGYYPIGIVYFNAVASDNADALGGTSLTQNILEMNNKYRKAYDPSLSPVDGKPLGGGANNVQSAAPGYSSGMKDNQTDAIGWTRCR
ncbi:hypothetical protein [Phocaeicola sp.]|uniref:hypothetical protein n=1 Tax=Phocaeicola sp. TaxID=2773926 RepID=UPI003A948878